MSTLEIPSDEDLDVVVGEVLATMAGFDALPTSEEPADAECWHVHLTGPDDHRYATVEVRAAERALVVLAVGLDLTPDESIDVAPELANQVAGGVKGLLEGEYHLTVPIFGGTEAVELTRRYYDIAAPILVRLCEPCECE